MTMKIESTTGKSIFNLFKIFLLSSGNDKIASFVSILPWLDCISDGVNDGTVLCACVSEEETAKDKILLKN